MKNYLTNLHVDFSWVSTIMTMIVVSAMAAGIVLVVGNLFEDRLWLFLFFDAAFYGSVWMFLIKSDRKHSFKIRFRSALIYGSLIMLTMVVLASATLAHFDLLIVRLHMLAFGLLFFVEFFFFLERKGKVV